MLCKVAGLFGVGRLGARADDAEEMRCVGRICGEGSLGVVPGGGVLLGGMILLGEGVGAVEGGQGVDVVLLEELGDAKVEEGKFGAGELVC